MQTYVLQDLVTAVSPRNQFSFINYLVEQKKIYRFLITEQQIISREEFSDYLSWACDRLDGLQFSQSVESIDFDDDRGLFEVRTINQTLWAKNICLGTGYDPWLPKAFYPALGDNCMHAAEIALRNPDFTGKRVMVAGKVVPTYSSIRCADTGVNRLSWIGFPAAPTSSLWINPPSPKNTSPRNTSIISIRCRRTYANRAIKAQKLPTDGISNHTLHTLYRELYMRFDVMHQTCNVRCWRSSQRGRISSCAPGTAWRIARRDLMPT